MFQSSRRAALAAGAGLFVASAPWRGARAQPRTVVDLVAGDGRFTRFIEFIIRSGMTEDLRGTGPFTVFAPTDAAYSAGSPALLQDLLESPGGGGGQSGGGGNIQGGPPDIVRLRAYVQYHVISGRALAAGELAGADRQLKTDNGNMLLVRGTGGQVVVANPAPGVPLGGFGAAGVNVLPPAPIVQPDMRTGNGVVHAIGGLIFPS